MRFLWVFVLLLFVSPVYGDDLEALKQTSQAFNRVAEKGQAAVVSITTMRRRVSRYDYFYSAGTSEGLGSGVIMSSEGDVLTNHHVIERADRVLVVLSDGREFEAEVVGSDPKTDLALLKIKGKDLPAISITDSDDIKVGDWAIAVGNPFGLSGTVTVGVISAVGRSDLEGDSYSEFIQTDAAINPGNSGGALLNIDGELVGINSAIYTQSGGYTGVGFAIPSNMAMRVLKDLKTKGKVVRGSLGVSVAPITSQVRLDLGLESKHGAYVKRIVPDSSADKAGLIVGDVILSYDGKKVLDFRSLRSKVNETSIGSSVILDVFREGQILSLPVVLEAKVVSKSFGDNDFDLLFGMSVVEMDEAIRDKYRLQAREGLLVVDVEPNSLAFLRFISPGDVIVEVNSKSVASLDEYYDIVEGLDSVLLRVQRGAYSRRVYLYRK